MSKSLKIILGSNRFKDKQLGANNAKYFPIPKNIEKWTSTLYSAMSAETNVMQTFVPRKTHNSGKNEGKTPLGASHVWTYKKNAWKRCVSAVPKQYAIIKGDLVPERIFTRGAKQQTDSKKRHLFKHKMISRQFVKSVRNHVTFEFVSFAQVSGGHSKAAAGSTG